MRTPAFLLVVSTEQESCPIPQLKVLLCLALHCDRIKEKIVVKGEVRGSMKSEL